MICRILNFSYSLVGKLGEKTNRTIRTAAYFTLFLFALLYGSSILDGVHHLIKCIIGALLMGVIIIFTMNGPIKPQRWNKTVSILWFGTGALQLLSGIFVSMEYLPLACIWLVGFPALFLVWNNRKDYPALFAEVAIAGNACFLLVILSSALCYPLGANAYGGILQNPNGMGQWITFAYPLILFLCHCEKRSKMKWLYYGEIGLVFLFCVLSRGRTALLAIVAMTLVWIVLRIRCCPKGVWDQWKRVPVFAVCVVIAGASFFLVNQAAEPISGYMELPQINADPEIWGDDIEMEDPEFQETDIPNHGDPTQNGSKNEHYLKKLLERILGMDKTGKSLEDYSSGRTGIWLEALESSNWMGHPSREHIITDRNGDVGSNVHNTIFQFIYDNGILTGLLFAVMMAYAWIKMFVLAWKRRAPTGVEVTCLTIQTGYILTSFLASLNLVFLYLIGFIYYLTFAVLFDKDNASIH